MKEKETDVVSINTRYPTKIRDFIKNEAKKEGRSFNAQIIWILRKHMEQQQKQGE